MPERMWLDPTDVSTGRTQLEITAYVKADPGADWGDAAIEAYMADRERGSAPIDYRIPNRQIVLPLNLRTVAGSGVGFQTIRRNLQAKVARIQQEGGWFARQTATGIFYCDVVNASLKLGGDWMQATRDVDMNAELRLEAIPDWYGAERTLPDHVEATNWEIQFVETNIAGDYPGRVRIVVDEDQGQPQKGLFWGVRSRHYSNATTAQLAYDVNTWSPLDTATGGAQVVHPNLSTSWTPVFSTNTPAGVALTHTGTYRVWLRCQAPNSTSTTRVRLLWDVGDFLNPVENRPVALPSIGQHIVDLGQVRLDRVPSGAHRWQGVVQASGSRGGEVFQAHRMWFQPLDDGGGVLRVPATVNLGLSGYSARDEFNQSAGALAGKTLPVGGAWSGFGDPDDFVVDANNRYVLRQATLDASVNAGRFALAGVGGLSNVVVQADLMQGLPVDRRMVALRYVDTNNHVRVGFRQSSGWTVEVVVGGNIVASAAGGFVTAPQVWYTVKASADATGNLMVWVGLAGGNLSNPVYVGTFSQLAAGGPLASGRVGLYDAATSGTMSPRAYDNFAAWTAQPDAVMFPNQSAELRTEGMFREDSTGTAYGPVTHDSGDLPRIPPSGAEGRPCQFLVKASRGDLDRLPDTGVDDISARVFYRPSWLFLG